jgi:hypothetical protein
MIAPDSSEKLFDHTNWEILRHLKPMPGSPTTNSDGAWDSLLRQWLKGFVGWKMRG